MSKTILEKMFLKSGYVAAIINQPEELNHELQTQQKTDTSLIDSYNFILGFYKTKENLKKEIGKIKESLMPNGLLWIAYPKGKLLETDLNRDILHELMKEYNFDGVSIVSLNSTWSAMRFKII